MASSSTVLRELFEYKDIAHAEAQLQRCLEKGDHDVAAEWMEKRMELHEMHFGQHHQLTLDAMYAALVHYHQLAARSLRTNNKETKSYLSKADKLCSMYMQHAQVTFHPVEKLRITIWKHMAVFLQRTNHTRNAIVYMKKARALIHQHRDEEDDDAMADDIELALNLCAAHSCLGKHTKASAYAKEALMLAQDQRIKSTTKEKQYRWTMLVVVAYHNLGVEHEFLGDFSQCLSCYRKAVHVAAHELRPSSETERQQRQQMQEMMENALEEAEQAMEMRKWTEIYPQKPMKWTKQHNPQHLLRHSRNAMSKQPPQVIKPKKQYGEKKSAKAYPTKQTESEEEEEEEARGKTEDVEEKENGDVFYNEVERSQTVAEAKQLNMKELSPQDTSDLDFHGALEINESKPTEESSPTTFTILPLATMQEPIAASSIVVLSPRPDPDTAIELSIVQETIDDLLDQLDH